MAERELYGPPDPESNQDEPLGDADPLYTGTADEPTPAEPMDDPADSGPRDGWGPEPDLGYGDISELVQDPMDQPPVGSLEAMVQDGMAGPDAFRDADMIDELMDDDPMQDMMGPLGMPGP
jgi:hypothetical protein